MASSPQSALITTTLASPVPRPSCRFLNSTALVATVMPPASSSSEPNVAPVQRVTSYCTSPLESVRRLHSSCESVGVMPEMVQPSKRAPMRVGFATSKELSSPST